jgi:hypothetical protein
MCCLSTKTKVRDMSSPSGNAFVPGGFLNMPKMSAKMQNVMTKTAFDGLVCEYEIPTDEGDVDLREFVTNRGDEVNRLLQQALHEHM